MQTLTEYIKQNYESKADFARKQGVVPQMVRYWENKGYHVNQGGQLVRVIRELKN